jgi:hypothetical protein
MDYWMRTNATRTGDCQIISINGSPDSVVGDIRDFFAKKPTVRFLDEFSQFFPKKLHP